MQDVKSVSKEKVTVRGRRMSDADVSSLTCWFYSLMFNSIQDFQLKGIVSVFVIHRVKKKIYLKV